MLETLEMNCTVCADLESQLPAIANEIRRLEGSAQNYRQVARLLIQRNRILDRLELHQRGQHLKAS